MEALDFIYEYEDEQRAVMLYLHRLLVDEFGLVDKIKHRIPFYYGRSWICYLNPTQDGRVEFAFVRGSELANEQGLLDSRGRKQVSGVIFSRAADIPTEIVEELIQEAIVLDETVPYAAKRK